MLSSALLSATAQGQTRSAPGGQQVQSVELQPLSGNRTQVTMVLAPDPNQPLDPDGPEQGGISPLQFGLGMKALGVGVASAIASVSFAVISNNHSIVANQVRRDLDRSGGNDASCGPSAPLGSSATCADLTNSVDQADRFRNAAIGTGLAAGLFVSAGIVTLMFDPSQEGMPVISAAVSPNYAGGTVTGVF